uniref:Uncharacterized protein n=1 Tax=Pristionchus pacificus TaxID=54126 RepID=A0A2A6C5J8_PRIPA|eukprot:PDM73434.1 hypothetical protein PRIPAC_40790 [Pristionchus pacificus]
MPSPEIMPDSLDSQRSLVSLQTTHHDAARHGGGRSLCLEAVRVQPVQLLQQLHHTGKGVADPADLLGDLGRFHVRVVGRNEDGYGQEQIGQDAAKRGKLLIGENVLNESAVVEGDRFRVGSDLHVPGTVIRIYR